MAELPRRRRWRRRVLTGIGLALLIVLMVIDRHGGPLYGGNATARYDGQWFEVERVVSGQTLTVAAPDGDAPVTRVRLWGVAVPEPSENTAAAGAARRGVEQLTEGGRVRLELAEHRIRDDFGRVLAFVHLPDGTMLNETLLVEGLARADERWEHRHVERFSLLERQARFDERGLWRSDPPAEP